MAEPELILKTTPPRVARQAWERPRLLQTWIDVHACTVIEVIAPAGFGKTTMLSHWRRRWMERGAWVAWITADIHDEPVRFVQALLQALQATSGLAVFGAIAKQHAATPGQESAALTAVLGEIAQRGTETVVMIDEAESLPESTLRACVQYLLLNAPANLRVVMGSRLALPLQVAELMAKGHGAVLGLEDLRFRAAESVEILSRRLRTPLTPDQCARLHDASEGWPIGLQLAIAKIERGADAASAIASLVADDADVHDYFVEALLFRLAPPLVDFLVRVSILDLLNTELCAAVTGDDTAGALLDQAAGTLPVTMSGERGGWIRVHALVRQFLQARFLELPAAEQTALRLRAAVWLADHGYFHEAARHAQAGGDAALAKKLALQSIWVLGTSGRLAEARVWLEQLPEQGSGEDVALRLAVAWVHAWGDRNAEALQLALEVANDPASSPQQCRAALRVAGGAAAYADQVGRYPEILARWPHVAGDMDDPVYLTAPLNGQAFTALHAGSTTQVREVATRVVAFGDRGSLRLACAFARTMVGLSHLWDGDARAAETAVRPWLAVADAEDGRRSMIACMYAALLAAALLERGHTEAARTLLGNRLDVIERGVPDAVLAAFRTLALVALDEGNENRALHVLAELEALGKRRRAPRLQFMAVVEQVRIHAAGRRVETAANKLVVLDELTRALDRPEFCILLPQCELAMAIARTNLALARDDLAMAHQQLEGADALATSLNRGRDIQTVKVLRAILAWKRHEPAASMLLSEALGLAEVGGNTRLLRDTHPLAVRMAAELRIQSAALIPRSGGAIAKAPDPAVDAASRDPAHTHVQSGLLTVKEAEILGLLGKGMSNKQIARILTISAETVKWHVKNIFAKLSAGSRKHAVDRARLLGLIDEDVMANDVHHRGVPLH
ncbi:MAG TPA: LuxR C-terminal-related transcriptional regulator [Rhodanobacteraceae bacterium]|nr:LuxR C-terminal-related transcriptional regulator [Rhodanobacteraceae bacterium]